MSTFSGEETTKLKMVSRTCYNCNAYDIHSMLCHVNTIEGEAKEPGDTCNEIVARVGMVFETAPGAVQFRKAFCEIVKRQTVTDMYVSRLIIKYMDSTGIITQGKDTFIFNGKKYVKDESGAAVSKLLCKILDSGIQEFSNYIENPNERHDEDTLKFLKSCRKALASFTQSNKLESLRKAFLLEKNQGSVEFNSNKRILPLDNCVYNLYTHEILRHSQNNHITMIVPAALIPEATAPQFEKHLNFVFPDEKTREYFLQAVASSLLRGRMEELIFFVWGASAGNGKSELFRMIITALGEFATWLDPHVFSDKRAGNATQPELLEAIGKALVVIDEPDKESMNASTFKNAANFADIAMRGLWESTKIRRWTATSFLLCNVIPPIDTKDAGNCRRIVVIPCKNKITDAMKEAGRVRAKGYEDITKFGEYVGKIESSGILNVLLAALKRFQANGYKLPEMSDEIRTATNEYIYRFNSVARFVNEQCIVDPDEVANAAEFNNRHRVYCVNVLGHDQHKLMQPQSVRDAMEALGHPYGVYKVSGKTVRGYKGIKIIMSLDFTAEIEGSDIVFNDCREFETPITPYQSLKVFNIPDVTVTT